MSQSVHLPRRFVAKPSGSNPLFEARTAMVGFIHDKPQSEVARRFCAEWLSNKLCRRAKPQSWLHFDTKIFVCLSRRSCWAQALHLLEQNRLQRRPPPLQETANTILIGSSAAGRPAFASCSIPCQAKVQIGPSMLEPVSSARSLEGISTWSSSGFRGHMERSKAVLFGSMKARSAFGPSITQTRVMGF